MVWPNFVSTIWNKYYCYSELPKGNTDSNIVAIPFKMEINTETNIYNIKYKIENDNEFIDYVDNINYINDNIESKIIVSHDRAVKKQVASIRNCRIENTF